MIEHVTQPGRAFYAGLLQALTQVMGNAKGYLFDHPPRVAHLARQIGLRMGLDEREVSELLFAAVLADLGMIGLAEEAWENPTPDLSFSARTRVRFHPRRSEELLRAIPHLEGVAPLVRHHHEWWDGTGYPDGLAGEDIPLAARILRLADTVCALGEARPHRPMRPRDEIRRLVDEGTGSEFGPDEAGVYLDLLDSGDLVEFHHQAFERALVRAAGVLLPREVSPLSSDQLLDILAGIIDAKDPYTAGHSRRVAILSVAVASQLGLGDRVRGTVWAAGYLHDVGKLSVPLRMLTKVGRLDDEEFGVVRSHPGLGASILEEIPSLRHLTTGVRYHHERWDGSGYPEGLRGDHIPLVARILAIADAYDAMTSGRAYRASRSHQEALDEIAACAGRHFGPDVAASFLSLPDHLFQAMRQPSGLRGDFFARHPLRYRASPVVVETRGAS